MKRLILCVSILLALGGCMKKDEGCTAVDPSVEKPAMISYCVSNNILYTQHSSGILYQIVDPGYGATPTPNSLIYVSYTGKLLDGTIFDAQASPTTGFYLRNTIDGWITGIPLIKKGGYIRMVIPSYMAYGCNGQGGIPPNSPLYFEVRLIDVQ